MNRTKEQTMGRGLASMALAGLLAAACLLPREAAAYDANATVHSVGDVGALYDAFVEINANGGDHVIILQSDITLSNRLWNSKAPAFSDCAGGLRQGNTVLLGEGHVITADVKGDCPGLALVGSATLSLGEPGYAQSLTFCGGGTSRSVYDSLIWVDEDAVLNMYDHVTLCDSRCAGVSAGVALYEDAVFNMYGGSMERLWSANCGGAVVTMDNSVFNLSGGEISECRNYGTFRTVYFTFGAGGGAVMVIDAGSMNMSGGTIRDCEAAMGCGGAISVCNQYPIGAATSATSVSPSVDLTGGTITGCTAATNGGAVCVCYYGSPNLHVGPGAVIRDNTATAGYGGGIMYFDYPYELPSDETVHGEFVIDEGAQIYNNAATAADDVLLYQGEMAFGAVGKGLVLKETQQEITGWYDDGVAVDKYVYDEFDTSRMVEVAPAKTTAMTALKAAHGVPPPPMDEDWDVPKSKTADEELVYTDEAVQEGKTVGITLQLPAKEYVRNIDVVFVMDRSTSAGGASAFATNACVLLDILGEKAQSTGANVRVGVVKYRGKAYDMVKALTQEMAGHAPDLSGYGPHEGMLLLEDDETSTLAQKIEILKEGVKLDKSNWFFKYDHEESAGTGSNIHGGLQMGKAWLDGDTETAASDKFLIVYTDGLGYLWAAPDGTPRTTYSQFALGNSINSLGYGPSSFRSANGMPNADQRVAQNKYYGDGSGWIPEGIDVVRFGPAFTSGASLVPNMEALLASTNSELTGDGPYQTDTLFQGFAFSIATNDSTAPILSHPIENATAANGFAADRMAPYQTYYAPDSTACKDVPYLESTPYVVVEQGGKYYYANVDNGDGTYSYDAGQPDGTAHYFVNSNFFMLHPTSIEKGVYMLGKAYEDALARGYHCALFWENNTANNQQFVMGEAFKQWAREKSEYECPIGASAADITAVFAKMNTAMAYLLARGTVGDEIPGYFELVMDGEGAPGSEQPFKICLNGVTQQVTHVAGTMTWSFGTPNESNEYPYVVTYEPRASMTERCSSRFEWAINVPVEKAAPVQLCYKLGLKDVDWALEVAQDGDGKIPTNGETTLSCSDSNGRRHATRFQVPDVGAVTTNSTVTYVWSGAVPPGRSAPVDTNLYPIYGSFPVDTNYSASTVIDGGYEFSGWSGASTNVMQPGGVVLSGSWTRVSSGPVFSARMLWTPEVADASGLFYGRLEVTLESGDASDVSAAWFVFTDRDNAQPKPGFKLPYYAYLAQPGRYAANYADVATFPDGAVPATARYSVLNASALSSLRVGRTAGFGISEAHRTAVPILPTKLAESETAISAYILDCVPPSQKVVGVAQADYLANLVVVFVYQAQGQWYKMEVLGDECTDATAIDAPLVKKVAKKAKLAQTAVTLNPNGGKAGTKSVTATKGLGMPAATAPTKAGCQLTGFYSAKTGGVQYYDGSMKSVRVWTSGAAKSTLYAHWKTATAKVTLDPNGGVAATRTVTATYGKKLPSAKAPTRAGYVFQGFYTAKSGGTMYYDAAMKPKVMWKSVSKTCTLYARWKAKTAKVTVNANGGAFGKAKTKAVTATYGKAMPTLAVPVRKGWRFVGVFNKKSGGTMYWDAKGRSARAWNGTAASYTFYARWARVPYGVTVWADETLVDAEGEAAMALFDGDESTGWQPAGAATEWNLIATYAKSFTAKGIAAVEDDESSETLEVNVSNDASHWLPIATAEDLPATFQYLWLHFEDEGGVAPHLYEIEVEE